MGCLQKKCPVHRVFPPFLYIVSWWRHICTPVPLSSGSTEKAWSGVFKKLSSIVPPFWYNVASYLQVTFGWLGTSAEGLKFITPVRTKVEVSGLKVTFDMIFSAPQDLMEGYKEATLTSASFCYTSTQLLGAPSRLEGEEGGPYVYVIPYAQVAAMSCS